MNNISYINLPYNLMITWKNIITEYPSFFAATNLEWKRLLAPDKYKEIIRTATR